MGPLDLGRGLPGQCMGVFKPGGVGGTLKVEVGEMNGTKRSSLEQQVLQTCGLGT